MKLLVRRKAASGAFANDGCGIWWRKRRKNLLQLLSYHSMPTPNRFRRLQKMKESLLGEFLYHS